MESGFLRHNLHEIWRNTQFSIAHGAFEKTPFFAVFGMRKMVSLKWQESSKLKHPATLNIIEEFPKHARP
jgi:hypothetical protein